MRHWKAQDRAVSPVIASIMLVAIAVVLSVVVYAWAARAPGGEAPESLALTQASATSADERSFGVASASPTLRWGDMQPLLSGTLLTYDGNLASDATWCRETPDGVCLTSAQHDPGALVQAGQRIRVHDSSLAGKTLQIRDPAANALLASVALR